MLLLVVGQRFKLLTKIKIFLTDKLAKKKGVTKIICIAVNDPNVMRAWGENQNVGNKILMAGDPYLKFTKSIGSPISITLIAAIAS